MDEQARKRGRLLGAAALSLVCHGAVILALLSARTYPPKAVEPRPVIVELINEQQLQTPSPTASAAKPLPPKPPPRRQIVKPAAAPSDQATTPADEPAAAESGPGLTELRARRSGDRRIRVSRPRL